MYSACRSSTLTGVCVTFTSRVFGICGPGNARKQPKSTLQFEWTPCQESNTFKTPSSSLRKFTPLRPSPPTSHYTLPSTLLGMCTNLCVIGSFSTPTPTHPTPSNASEHVQQATCDWLVQGGGTAAPPFILLLLFTIYSLYFIIHYFIVHYLLQRLYIHTFTQTHTQNPHSKKVSRVNESASKYLLSHRFSHTHTYILYINIYNI